MRAFIHKNPWASRGEKRRTRKREKRRWGKIKLRLLHINKRILDIFEFEKEKHEYQLSNYTYTAAWGLM